MSDGRQRRSSKGSGDIQLRQNKRDRATLPHLPTACLFRSGCRHLAFSLFGDRLQMTQPLCIPVTLHPDVVVRSNDELADAMAYPRPHRCYNSACGRNPSNVIVWSIPLRYCNPASGAQFYGPVGIVSGGHTAGILAVCQAPNFTAPPRRQ